MRFKIHRYVAGHRRGKYGRFSVVLYGQNMTRSMHNTIHRRMFFHTLRHYLFPRFSAGCSMFFSQTGNVPDGAERPRGGVHFCWAGRAAHRYTKPGDAAARLQPQVSRAQACGSPRLRYGGWGCTDKKENKIFLIYKEIPMGSVAKSYMRKDFLIFEEMRKYLTICEEAVSHLWLCNRSFLNFLIYEENFILFYHCDGLQHKMW